MLDLSQPQPYIHNMNTTTKHAARNLEAGFAAAGLKVRVRDLGLKFRVCPKGEAEFPQDKVAVILNGLGFTSASGKAIDWSAFNGTREVFAYKPGAIVRV